MTEGARGGGQDATPALVLLDGRQRKADAGAATLSLIAEARRHLVEAQTLPDVRRVMEAASVAVDAAQRAAKLAEGQRLAAEVVDAASDAANDAAAIRNEAQAKAGEMLRQMAERGQRETGGRPQKPSQAATVSLDDLGVTRSESSRWQQVAAVPAAVRQEYHHTTKTARGEVSTAGLLRYARRATGGGSEGQVQAAREPDGRAAKTPKEQAALRQILLGAHRELVRAAELRKYDAWLLVDGLHRGQRRQLRSTVAALSAWLGEVTRALDSKDSNEEVI
jgi:hypothetical protein